MHIASFLRCVILSSVTCPSLPYSSALYHKQRNLTKKGIEHKICVLIFSTNFVQKSSLSERNSAHIIINVHRCSHEVCYSCQIVFKLEYSQQVFEKYPDIKFNENPFSGSRILPCEKTDVT